jgi:hypothetical protein
VLRAGLPDTGLEATGNRSDEPRIRVWSASWAAKVFGAKILLQNRGETSGFAVLLLGPLARDSNMIGSDKHQPHRGIATCGVRVRAHRVRLLDKQISLRSRKPWDANPELDLNPESPRYRSHTDTGFDLGVRRERDALPPRDILHDSQEASRIAGYFSDSSGAVPPIELLVQDEPFTIKPRHSILVNDSNAHLACALAGLGLVHTLDFNMRASIDRGELVVVLKEYRPKPLEVFMVYPPSRRSAKVRVFGDWVTQIFGRLVQQ